MNIKVRLGNGEIRTGKWSTDRRKATVKISGHKMTVRLQTLEVPDEAHHLIREILRQDEDQVFWAE